MACHHCSSDGTLPRCQKRRGHCDIESVSEPDQDFLERSLLAAAADQNSCESGSGPSEGLMAEAQAGLKNSRRPSNPQLTTPPSLCHGTQLQSNQTFRNSRFHTVSRQAWRYCHSLRIVKLLGTVVIGYAAFQGCYSRMTVEMPGCVELGVLGVLCSGTGWRRCRWSLPPAPLQMELPPGHGAVIGQYAFEECAKLAQLSLPRESHGWGCADHPPSRCPTGGLLLEWHSASGARQ